MDCKLYTKVGEAKKRGTPLLPRLRVAPKISLWQYNITKLCVVGRRRKGKDVSPTFAMAMLFIFPCPCALPAGGHSEERRRANDGDACRPPRGRNAQHAFPAASWGGPPPERWRQTAAQGGEATCVTLRRKSLLLALSGEGRSPRMTGRAAPPAAGPLWGPQQWRQASTAPEARRRTRAHFYGRSGFTSDEFNGAVGRRWGHFPLHEELYSTKSYPVGINLACLARAPPVITPIIGTE